MTFEDRILEKLRDLPADKQQEVLEFVDSLKKNGETTPLRSPLGLWADLRFHVTEGDIAEARREMWGKFPRNLDR